MKKIILLFCFAVTAGMVIGQAKVFSNGKTVVGDNTGFTATGPSAPLGTLNVAAPVQGGQVLFEAIDGTQAANNGYFRIAEGGGGAAVFIPTFEFKGDGIPGLGGQFKSLLSATNDVRNISFASMIIDGRTESNTPLANADVLLVRNYTTQMMKVMANGNVGIGVLTPAHKLHVNGNVVANNIAAPSDKRLKKNIKPFSAGLDEILKLKPVTFQYNGKGSIEDTKTVHTGILAQELQEVIPSFVKDLKLVENQKEIEVAQANSEKNFGVNTAKAEYTDYLSINDTGLKYVAINAIKELNAMIEAQADKIAQLEAKFAEISSVDGVHSGQVTLASYDIAELGQNSPNPFNGETLIDYVIPTNAKSSKMHFMDMNGRLLKSVSLDHVGEGELRVNLDEIPAGTYTYQLVVDGKLVDTKKMSVTR